MEHIWYKALVKNPELLGSPFKMGSKIVYRRVFTDKDQWLVYQGYGPHIRILSTEQMKETIIALRVEPFSQHMLKADNCQRINKNFKFAVSNI